MIGRDDWLRDPRHAHAMLALTPRQREAVTWRYEHDLSCEETAKRMGISRAAVSQLVTRARRSMREHWRVFYGE